MYVNSMSVCMCMCEQYVCMCEQYVCICMHICMCVYVYMSGYIKDHLPCLWIESEPGLEFINLAALVSH